MKRFIESGENVPAVYPPDNDMVDYPWHIDTFMSRHDRML